MTGGLICTWDEGVMVLNHCQVANTQLLVSPLVMFSVTLGPIV